MTLRRILTAVFVCLTPVLAHAQTSYIAPDGHSRYPGVTIFCPNGTGVTPCSFAGTGGGGASGSVSITSGGATVSAANRFPVTDSSLDAVISGGALSVSLGSGSAVSLSQGGAVLSSTNSLPVADTTLDALISGGALAVAGSVTLSGTPAVTLGAGSAAIGSVSVTNLPATQAVSAAALPLPAGAATVGAQTAPFAPVAPGTATATNAVVIGCLSNTSLPSFSAGQEGAVPCDSSGRPYVVTVPSANNVPSYLQAVSSGGATVFRAINTAASTMAATIKSSTGMVYGYEGCNSGSTAAFLRLFALSSTPVPGTSTPSISKLLAAGTCQGFQTPIGLALSGGIGVDVTAGSMADSDTTAIATASQVTVEVYYK